MIFHIPIFTQVLFLGSLQAHCVKQPVGGGQQHCICLGRLSPPTPGWHDLCLRVYSVLGLSPCIPERASDSTICPKILIEYA